MTSFQSYPVSKIWFDRSTRQRRDLGDLTELAASIRAVGLINPIVITREGQLIAGERRLAAVQSLGWSHTIVQFREDLSDIEREQLELDENIRRLDLAWQDRALAMLRYHHLCAPATIEQTAERIGLSEPVVRRNIQVAQAIKAGDKRIIEAPKFSVALGILERLSARRADVEGAAVDNLLAGPRPVLKIDGQETEPVVEPVKMPEDWAPILNVDFAEWIKDFSGPPFNFIHCDFPYGINADKHDQGAAHGGYADTAETYWNLIDVLGQASCIAPAAHMIFWFSMLNYGQTLKALTAADWDVNPTPLIWWRSDNAGILPDPRRMPRQVYETAFLCSRGDRFLVGARSNLIGAPSTKQYHPSEKPLLPLAHFFSMLVDDTTRMLDPTCGSGNALIAAHRLGARSVLGLERDPEYHRLATLNWKENTNDD